MRTSGAPPRRSNLHWLMAAVCASGLGLIVATSPAAAQTPDTAQPSPAQPAKASDAPPPVDPRPAESQPATAAWRDTTVWPDTTVWIDDNGVPRPLVGVTYEEFAAAWRSYKGVDAAERTPRYTLNALRVVGTLTVDEPSIARLEASVDLQVQDEGRVAVPIRLSNAIFTGDLQQLDPQQEHLAYDAQRGGYVLWLQGDAPAKQRAIRLGLIARIARTAEGVRLELNLPRATQSEVELNIAGAVVAPGVTGGALLEAEPLSNGGTRLLIRGAVGPTVVSFRTPAEQRPTQQAVLRSQGGQVHVRIDDRSIRTTARLTVDGLRQPFDRFLVRLPRGAVPVLDALERSEEVRVELVTESNKQGQDSERALVAVSRANRSVEPLSVQLVTEMPVTSPKGGDVERSEIDLGGLEVVGAVEQSGYVAVSVVEGVQVDWEPRVGVSQIGINELPEELQRLAPSRALYFYRPSWRLPIRVAKRTPRVEATPAYKLEVLPDTLRLNVDTNFSVFGGGEFEFVYNLNGWQRPSSDPSGPVGLIDVDLTQVAEGTLDNQWDDKLIVPLTRAAGRQTEVGLRFEQPLAIGTPIDVQLPTPIVDALGAGRLVVMVHPSVELQINTEQLAGLEPLAVSPDPQSPADPAGLRTRAYRIASPGEVPTRFVAMASARPGRLEAASQSRVTLARNAIEVEQVLRYDALYQPIDHLLLWAPAGLDLGDEPQFQLATDSLLDVAEQTSPETVQVTGELIDQIDDLGGQAAPGDEAGSLWKVTLPGPRLGAFKLQARYALPRLLSASEPTSDVVVTPLLKPVLSDNVTWKSLVEATGPPGQGVALATGEGGGWETEFPSAGDTPVEKLRLVASAEAGPLRLVFSTLATETTSTAVVSHAWFQTWRSNGELQTRAVYRVMARGDQLELELPPGVDVKQVECRIDGAIRSARLASDNRLVLLDERLADGAEHTIAMRYLQTALDWQTTRLAVPRLFADATQTVCYWEVVQPSLEHVVTTPQGFFGAFRWGWGPGGWGRQPLLTSEQLAEQVGAEVGLISSAGENRYLFSGIGVPEGERVVHSVSRVTVVLVASAVVVAIGFALQQLRLLRYRATYYVLLFMLGTSGLLAPGPFVLMLQASAVGLLLTAATLFADRWVRPPASTIVLSDQSTSLRRNLPPAPVSTNAATVSVKPADAMREA